jgi:hypothetical protein
MMKAMVGVLVGQMGAAYRGFLQKVLMCMKQIK